MLLYYVYLHKGSTIFITYVVLHTDLLFYPRFFSQIPKYTVFIVQAYQTSPYVVPRGSIFLSKLCSSFAGSSDGEMNVQSACTLNTRYFNSELNFQGTDIISGEKEKILNFFLIFLILFQNNSGTDILNRQRLL
jgi:hypothetical protein